MEIIHADSLSIGVILLIVFVALGIGKILTGVAVWRFLKLKDRDKQDNNSHKDR